jgi:hypothetical protein
MKTRLMLASAIVAMVIPVASGTASVRGTTAVPSKLIGAWNRNVKQANYNKYGQGQQGFLVGVWTMVVKKNGEADFYTPGSFSYTPGCVAKHTCFSDFSGRFAATASRVTLTSSDARVCVGKVTYSWKVAGKSLTMKVIAETTKACTPLEALLEGVWKQTRT